MSIIHAIVLGLVQGLGEFLPISSSAHLILAPYFFSWSDQGLAFDVALHWGTLLAVILYFRKDLKNIVRGFFHTLRKSTRDWANGYQKLAWLLIISSVPGAIVGKILEKEVEHAFRNPLLIAGTMSGFGIILYAADYFSKKEKTLNDVNWKSSLIVGVAQVLAIIPGVSRSGATMAMARFLKFNREDAARFSFLMSIPITLGAGLLKIPDISFQQDKAALIVGFLSAFVFGLLAIKYLLRYISKRSFAVFAWYRFLLAAIIIIVYFIRN
jgi:undecaprenyl-diphosphatase